MTALLSFFFISFNLIISSGCDYFYNEQKKKSTTEITSDTIPGKQQSRPVVQITKPYDSLVFSSVKYLKSSSGTKSVVFSKDMRFLYAMNLEGMSVIEFSQATKEITRTFKFRRTPGTGWDYDTDRPISSFEEKPVEAFLSNHDSIIWVSLHNAEGIVPIHLFGEKQRTRKTGQPGDKLIYMEDGKGVRIDSFFVPLIKTGKTPKVIACSSDDKYILVSNWHSFDVSVLKIDVNNYPFATLIKNIKVPSIPRGIVIDEKNHKSYIAIMGGASLSVIDNDTWSYQGDIQVAANPRHVLQDNKSRLFVSYNKIAKIGCVDPATGKTLFTANTATQPRSMVLSKDNKFIFVTCYSGNKLMVFKILDDRFELVSDLECVGNPVGVDVFEDNENTEVWVCSYATGMISVFNFKKK